MLVLALCGALVTAPAFGQPARLRDIAPSAQRTANAAPAAAFVPAADWRPGEPDQRSCSRSRRKFWQDSDGWTVKTVTVCQ